MEPLPAFLGELAASIEWPDPGEDGSTTLDKGTTSRLNMLLGGLLHYIETQWAKCGQPTDAK